MVFVLGELREYLNHGHNIVTREKVSFSFLYWTIIKIWMIHSNDSDDSRFTLVY